MRQLSLIFFVIYLVGCNDAASPAKEAVKYQLRNPDSAEFRDVRIYEDGNLVCGEVNADNAYGGKTGFKGFVYQDGSVSLEDSEYGMGAYVAGLGKCSEAIMKTLSPESRAKVEAEMKQYTN
jgi:hypothetical protein